MTRKLSFRNAKHSLLILFLGLVTTINGFGAPTNEKTMEEMPPPVNCNALIMPGTVSGMQSTCGTSLDPTVISNVTSASSSEGPIRYLWMYRNASTAYAWTTTGVTTDSIDPGVITETTEYVRCVGLVGCPTFPSETNVIRISLFPPFNPSVTVSSDITCNGSMDGTASITVSGGGGPGSYYYQWNNGATTASLSGLGAGIYSVTVTDTNGCTTSGSTTIVEPTALSEVTTSTDVTCNDAGDGSATISVSGGTTPYTYLWSDGQTTATASALDAGSYTVTVTDASGCTISSSVTLTEPSAIVASSTTSPMSCDTQNDASITLTVSGGTAPYTYLWSNGETTSDISSLANGTYTVTITDANGCTASETATIALSPINCCDLILPGTIGYNQSNCGPFNANTLISLTPGASGYGANVEYLWLYRNASTSNNWISTGITTDTLAPGLVSMTTQYLRCARNQGCITYPGESNVITITIYPVPTATTVVTDVLCNGGSNGSIMATATSGTSPYTYLWSDGQTTATATGLSAGTYTVTVTDANGCTGMSNATVNEPTALTEVTSSTDVSCFDGTDGTATIMVSGGTPSYTYLWSTGDTAVSISGLSSGTYTVTATDANGCTINGTTTITEPTALTEVTTSTNVSCNGGTDGTATMTVSGGTPGYTYLWSDGQTAAMATGLASGTYTVTATDANGCTISGSATITEPTALAEVTTSTNVLCNGGNSGTAMTIVSGGTPPYTYAWSNGNSAASISGLIAGTYSVTVTDANGCTISSSVTITEPAPLVVSSTAGTILCNGDSTTVTVTAAGGTGNNTIFSVNRTIANGSVVGTITTDGTIGVITSSNILDWDLTITDANGSLQLIGPSGASNSAFGVGGSNLTSTGTELKWDFSVAGGTYSLFQSPFVGAYGLNFWCLNGSQGQCSGDPFSEVVNVTADELVVYSGLETVATSTSIGGYAGTGTFTVGAGTHTFVVTDANGCTDSTTITVTEPAALTEVTTSTDVSCNGGTDGSATMTVSGGTPGYTYLWSDGQTTAMATGLAAGTYTVTATDTNGCTISGSATITEPAVLTEVTTSTDVSCNGGTDGTATFTVSGGTAPYTYLWSDGQTAAMATGLATGTYTVTATDANGCTISGSATINEPTLLVVNYENSDVSCFGLTDAQADAFVSGGTMPYTYLWSTGATTSNVNNLGAGTYTVTVTDANGCVASATITVTQPAQLLGNKSGTNVSCNGGADGTATIAVLGGTMPYTYLWNDPSAQTTATATGLVAGLYTVLVTDANGCTLNKTVTITEPDALTEVTTSTNASCNAGIDGTAMITVSGGTMPYTYAWSNGETTASISGLGVGTYTVTVTDANGCTISGSVTITEPTALAQVITSTDVSCNAGTDGTATITVSGGTMPYTYLWDDGQTTASLSGEVSAGTYTVTVTDANGCTISGSVTITEPTALTQVTTSTDVSCNTGTNGTATIAVSGGTPSYTYLWSNGETTATISGLGAGTYTVIATDANGCTIAGSATIIEPTALAEVTTSTNVSCNGADDGTAMVVVTGGTMPYTYMWSNQEMTASISGLAGGTYTVVVTDANGCSLTQTVTVTEPTLLTSVSSTISNVSCNSYTDGSATITVSGGTMPYTYLWSDGQTTATAIELGVGTYTVTATDANGCTTDETITITEPLELHAVTTYTDASCFGSCDGTGTIVLVGGVMPYTYLWSTGGTAASETGLCAGSYTVTATDANNCLATAATVISEPAEIAVSFTVNVSNSTILASGQNGSVPYTYSWANGGTSSLLTGAVDGTYYTVTVTDANGCSKTDSVLYTAVTPIIVNVGPNPVTTTATMQISSPVSTNINVNIYDAQGSIIENSYNGHLEAEVILELVFDGNNIEPGLYFCRVTTSEGMSTSKKILLAK